MFVFLSKLYCMYHTFTDVPPVHPEKRPRWPQPLRSVAVIELFKRCVDFNHRSIAVGLDQSELVTVCWLDGLVSGEMVSDLVLRPLTERSRTGELTVESLAPLLLQGGIYAYTVQKRTQLDDVISDLCHGCCAIILDSPALALCFETRSANVRAIGEPTLEKSLKGAKDAFVETLRTNTALLRRRLATPSLKSIESSLGRKSSTRVALLYVEDVVSPELVREVARRLDRLDVDAVLSTGELEEVLSDAPRSPFPQVIHTERPDRFAQYLSQGRVGLLVDGLPIGLIVPVSFAEFMKVNTDVSQHFLVASALSVLRWLSLLLALFLPASYVAMAMYHQEMIPTQLLLSIIEAKQNVPFSTLLEVLGMMLSFIMLQEAGLRLPNPIGDTVSIIGALIVGQSAVEAQVVSPIAIIVVAVSGIACYTLPSQDLASAVRLSSILALFAAALAGLYGVGLYACLLLWHLCSMDSFGLSYLAPLTEDRAGGLRRLLLRRPPHLRQLRDKLLKPRDRRRRA